MNMNLMRITTNILCLRWRKVSVEFFQVTSKQTYKFTHVFVLHQYLMSFNVCSRNKKKSNETLQVWQSTVLIEILELRKGNRRQTPTNHKPINRFRFIHAEIVLSFLFFCFFYLFLWHANLKMFVFITPILSRYFLL